MPFGYCSCHVAILSATWQFACVHSFFTQFFRAILEAFWYSKWVMRHTVGKPQMSTFQWYKVYMNQSSEGKFMTPRSWVVRAVFSYFSVEDSGQMGEATGEPRVASCSWSCTLSYSSGLAGQIAVSWKESMCEGGCLRRKTRQIFSAFSLFFVCVCAHGWPSSRCPFSTFLVPSESLCYPIS